MPCEADGSAKSRAIISPAIINIILPILKFPVNYHPLKEVACDYAKSRVASGGLTKPP